MANTPKTRLKCPFCNMLVWTSQLDKEPTKPTFYRQLSKGQHGFSYEPVTYNTELRKKLRDHLIETLKLLGDEALIDEIDLETVAELIRTKRRAKRRAEIVRNTDTIYEAERRYAHIEAEAHREAKAEYETHNLRQKQIDQMKEELEG